MYQITPQIWQGRFASDRLLTSLRYHGVTHIVNVSDAPCRRAPDDGPFVALRHIPMVDGVLIPADAATKSLQAIHDAICTKNSSVYVHCVAGWNRSPTVVWLYLLACGVPSEQAKQMISRVSLDSVPGHPKLITPQLIQAVQTYGKSNFLPHPCPCSLGAMDRIF